MRGSPSRRIREIMYKSLVRHEFVGSAILRKIYVERYNSNRPHVRDVTGYRSRSRNLVMPLSRVSQGKFTEPIIAELERSDVEDPSWLENIRARCLGGISIRGDLPADASGTSCLLSYLGRVGESPSSGGRENNHFFRLAVEIGIRPNWDELTDTSEIVTFSPIDSAPILVPESVDGASLLEKSTEALSKATLEDTKSMLLYFQTTPPTSKYLWLEYNEHLASVSRYRKDRVNTSPFSRLIKGLYPPGKWETSLVDPREEILLNPDAYTFRELLYVTGDILPANTNKNMLSSSWLQDHLLRGEMRFSTDIWNFSPKSGWTQLIFRNPSLSRNTETISLTDVLDTDVFMIGYGTPERYWTYELEDLISAFRFDEEYFVVLFRHPEDPTILYTEQEISDLTALLEILPRVPQVLGLLENIQLGRELKPKYPSVKEIQQKFNLLSSKGKEELKSLFSQLLFLGMYMRRWLGPGHPYPLLEKDTLGIYQENEIALVLSHFLSMLSELSLAALNFYQTMVYVHTEMVNGEWKHDTKIFHVYMGGITETKTCIRMASKKLVITAAYFLHTLHAIVPFEGISTIENIQ